jgi:uncharacterized protein YhaN
MSDERSVTRYVVMPYHLHELPKELDGMNVVHVVKYDDYRALQARVEELEKQLSEDVAPFKDVAGEKWTEKIGEAHVPVMRGSPNLHGFIAMLHSSAADLQAKLTAAQEAVTTQAKLFVDMKSYADHVEMKLAACEQEKGRLLDELIAQEARLTALTEENERLKRGEEAGEHRNTPAG